MSKLPKRQDISESQDEELDDIEDEEMPELETPQVPEYKLVDVMREIKSLSNDFCAMSEAVKALGADVIKNNEENAAVFTDFQAQIQELQRAFIAVTDQVLAIPQTKTPIRRVEPDKPATQQTSESGVTEAELDSIDWRDSKGNYGGQWIFRWEKGSKNPYEKTEKLQGIIINGGGKAKLFGRTYKFSGDNGMFIARTDKKR